MVWFSAAAVPAGEPADWSALPMAHAAAHIATAKSALILEFMVLKGVALSLRTFGRPPLFRL
jgi:hypothetical protein